MQQYPPQLSKDCTERLLVVADEGVLSAQSCPVGGGQYMLTGCLPTLCSRPADLSGFLTPSETNVDLSLGAFEVSATCAPGFNGNPITAACATSGEYTLDGCSENGCTFDAAAAAALGYRVQTPGGSTVSGLGAINCVDADLWVWTDMIISPRASCSTGRVGVPFALQGCSERAVCATMDCGSYITTRGNRGFVTDNAASELRCVGVTCDGPACEGCPMVDLDVCCTMVPPSRSVQVTLTLDMDISEWTGPTQLMQDLATVLSMPREQLEFQIANPGSVIVVEFLMLPPGADDKALLLAQMVNDTSSAFWTTSFMTARTAQSVPVALTDDSGDVHVWVAPSDVSSGYTPRVVDEIDCEGDDWEEEDCQVKTEGFGANIITAVVYYIVLPSLVVICIAMKVMADKKLEKEKQHSESERHLVQSNPMFDRTDSPDGNGSPPAHVPKEVTITIRGEGKLGLVFHKVGDLPLYVYSCTPFTLLLVYFPPLLLCFLNVYSTFPSIVRVVCRWR